MSNIIVSYRCFFPKAAYFKSTANIAKMATDVGYGGIEFLPTWRFVWEMKRYGKLLCPDKMVSSGHRDWRIDRIYLARFDDKPDWSYQLREKADLLFPPTNVCLSALQKFQKVYKKPVSTTWFEDTKNFSPVMLELHGYKCGVDEKDLFRWLKKESKNRGVVVDTTKFTKWLEDENLTKRKDIILEKLVPHIFEVHYRQIKSDNKYKLAPAKEGRQLIEKLISYGYKGKIVIEFGWPDLDISPFGLIKEDMKSFRKIHRDLNKISKIVG